MMNPLADRERPTTRILLAALLLTLLALLAAACGGDAEPVDAGAGPEDAPDDDTPIPVEPDGGIGDGAEPLPGAEDAPSDGDWHGAQLAETNCPGTTWQRVEATHFGFSVPADFVDQDAQGIDSEVGFWTSPGGGIEVSFDYGWYSNPLIPQQGPTERQDIVYSGFSGYQVMAGPDSTWDGKHLIGVHFPEVSTDDGEIWNLLTLQVGYADPADEIIGRCIVGSIEWKVEAPGEG